MNISFKLPHILLVDDNPQDVRSITENLREGGIPHRLSVANNGEEAMGLLYGINNHPLVRPDLILLDLSLDLSLPKVTGYDVLSHVKNNVYLRSIPVVTYSNSTSPADIERAYDLAANCYIAKPAEGGEWGPFVRAFQEFWLRLVAFPESKRQSIPNVAGG